MTGAIIITVVSLGCLAGMAYMFAAAPLVDADEYPCDETQDDPRPAQILRDAQKGVRL